ncbi:hypothetical protein C2845_PM05G21820 [Panicum miliaceum]|uniref:Uncharacterized protein n=1 Tax=Panicum miliaceum TaxID=4540 RepID=A0A3L6SZ14_PANMI|nr:hypothetical protein C2845_PM05G21820 [Panicum miliaceum]
MGVRYENRAVPPKPAKRGRGAGSSTVVEPASKRGKSVVKVSEPSVQIAPGKPPRQPSSKVAAGRAEAQKRKAADINIENLMIELGGLIGGPPGAEGDAGAGTPARAGGSSAKAGHFNFEEFGKNLAAYGAESLRHIATFLSLKVWDLRTLLGLIEIDRVFMQSLMANKALAEKVKQSNEFLLKTSTKSLQLTMDNQKLKDENKVFENLWVLPSGQVERLQAKSEELENVVEKLRATATDNEKVLENLQVTIEKDATKVKALEAEMASALDASNVAGTSGAGSADGDGDQDSKV